ncbi:MAG: hypothetical protein AB7I38_11830 [Dehalococcoidia bacterium]
MTATAGAPGSAGPQAQVAGCRAKRHGTASAYTKHECRCPSALADVARRRAVERSATMTLPSAFVDRVGTVRRLRALAWLGHGNRTLAAALGWPVKAVHETRAGWRPGRIRRDRAAAVAVVYTRLRKLPGVEPEARELARARGWLPAAAWDDDVFAIDDPAVPDELAAATLGAPAALRRLRLAEYLAAARRAARRAELACAHLAAAREARHAGPT